jgi:CheY-like chemotaxis protein
MDGPTATKEIRALGYTGKIFGITGNSRQADMDMFMRAGATAVHPKPVDVNALLWAVSWGVRDE